MLSARTNSSLYPRICEVKYDDDDFVNEFGANDSTVDSQIQQIIRQKSGTKNFNLKDELGESSSETSLIDFTYNNIAALKTSTNLSNAKPQPFRFSLRRKNVNNEENNESNLKQSQDNIEIYDLLNTIHIPTNELTRRTSSISTSKYTELSLNAKGLNVHRNNSDAKNSDIIYKTGYPRTTMPSLKRSHTMGNIYEINIEQNSTEDLNKDSTNKKVQEKMTRASLITNFKNMNTITTSNYALKKKAFENTNANVINQSYTQSNQLVPLTKKSSDFNLTNMNSYSNVFLKKVESDATISKPNNLNVQYVSLGGKVNPSQKVLTEKPKPKYIGNRSYNTFDKLVKMTKEHALNKNGNDNNLNGNQQNKANNEESNGQITSETNKKSKTNLKDKSDKYQKSNEDIKSLTSNSTNSLSSKNSGPNGKGKGKGKKKIKKMFSEKIDFNKIIEYEESLSSGSGEEFDDNGRSINETNGRPNAAVLEKRKRRELIRINDMVNVQEEHGLDQKIKKNNYEAILEEKSDFFGEGGKENRKNSSKLKLIENESLNDSNSRLMNLMNKKPMQINKKFSNKNDAKLDSSTNNNQNLQGDGDRKVEKKETEKLDSIKDLETNEEKPKPKIKYNVQLRSLDFKFSGENDSLENDEHSTREGDDWLLKWCIVKENLFRNCEQAFRKYDIKRNGFLNGKNLIDAIAETSKLDNLKMNYLFSVLDLCGADPFKYGVDIKLFIIMTALAHRISHLDDEWFKNMLPQLDLSTVENKVFKVKNLWNFLVDKSLRKILISDLMIEFEAGGVTAEHVEYTRRKFLQKRYFDLLDYLTYIPLFVYIHDRIIKNPLDKKKEI